MAVDFASLGGWVDDPGQVAAVASTMPMPLFAAAAPHLAGSGANRTVLLYKAWKDVNGGYLPYPAQQIGDCVSHGFGHGVDLLQCVRIAVGKEPEEFKETATEAVYGMARVDIGGGGLWGDGAVGAWAAKAVTTIGTVSREVVGPYDGRRAKQWGRGSGVPDEIRSAAREHKVKTSSMVTTYDQLEDALANGYPVPVCSSWGFTLERDAQGFCRAKGRWDHCMLICGVRTDRPGACIMQSWGMDVPSGPLDLDQPPNSFWVDRAVVEKMLAAQDSWTLSGFDGYPSQKLPDHWTWAGFA